MLGNVWEWMADAEHDNYIDAPLDGSVWEGRASAELVIRAVAGSIGIVAALLIVAFVLPEFICDRRMR